MGTKKQYQIAWVDIQTPFYSRRIKCAVLSYPFCELILSVIPEIQVCSNETIQKWEQDYFNNNSHAPYTEKLCDDMEDEEGKLN